MPNPHMNFLIELAYVDGVLQLEEKELIFRIGRANGIPDNEIEHAIKYPKSQVTNLKSLPEDEKYKYLYHIIQLMKADGKFFKDEIKYCSHIAARLGYDQAVMFELITKVSKHEISVDDDLELKESVQSYLK